MPSLRDMVDHKVIVAAAPRAKDMSPAAKHIVDHVSDPQGSTKDSFSKLTQKKLEYDQAREEAQRQLAPVQSVIDHINQMHGIQPGRATPGMAQGGMNPDDPEQQLDEQGNPVNMPGNTMQQMNSNRPSQVGTQPGVAPGPQQSVVPPKMGMAKPGGPTAGQGNKFNKQAAPPKGNKKMPGAKGPGDPKVANKAKQAQNNSSRSIKLNITGSNITAGGPGSGRKPSFQSTDKGQLNNFHTQLLNKGYEYDHSYGDKRENGLVTHVYYKGNIRDKSVNSMGRQSGHIFERASGRHSVDLGLDKSMAASSSGDLGYKISPGASSRLETQLGIGTLKFGGVTSTAESVHALASGLSDKATDMGEQSEQAYNPKLSASRKRKIGAKRGWSTRGKGHLSAKEKLAHYSRNRKKIV